MKRVVIYIRVSTKEQQESGYSIPEQKERLIAFCKSRGWMIVDIVVDGGYTGSNLHRPGIHKVITMAEEKAVDIVLVYKLDRLSRSQKETLYLIEDVFLPNSVDFVSVTESFDTGSALGKFMLSILSAFAQLEREQIRDRTMSGRLGRSKKGLWHGGGVEPIGYSYVDGHLVKDEAEAEQIGMIYTMYADGYTVTEISCEMDGYTTKHGDWRHTGTISAVLDNPLYAGYVHFDGVITAGDHKAIVSRDLYDKVKKMRERVKFAPAGTVKNPLAGLVWCKRCGAKYFLRKYHSGKNYYCCYSRAKVNKRMIKDPDCKNHNVPEGIIHGKLQDAIRELLEDPSRVRERQKTRKEGAGFASMQKIEEIDAQIGRLFDAYQRGQSEYEEISDRISRLYHEKELLIRSVESDFADIRDFDAESLRVELQSADVSEVMGNRHLLSRLIDKITVDGDDIHISWSFDD